MLIIYNLPGLLVGLAGLAGGFAGLLLSGSIGVGLSAVAAVWFAAGFWWRRRPAADELGRPAKRPWPALFFVPLPFLAVPLALLGALAVAFERTRADAPPDPLAEAFRVDEALLNAAPATGDADLARRVLATLEEVTVEAAGARNYSVFVRRKPGAVLVLMKAPNLKTYGDAAREQLVKAVAEIVRAGAPGDPPAVYVGVKGRALFGAIRTPTGGVRTGGAVVPKPLYAFYEETPGEPDPPRSPPAVAADAADAPEPPEPPPTAPETAADSPARPREPAGEPREITLVIVRTVGTVDRDAAPAAIEWDLTKYDGYVPGSLRIDWDAGTIALAAVPDSRADRFASVPPLGVGLIVKEAPAPRPPGPRGGAVAGRDGEPDGNAEPDSPPARTRFPDFPDFPNRPRGEPAGEPREVVRYLRESHRPVDRDAAPAAVERELAKYDGYVAGSARIDWEAGTATFSAVPGSRADRFAPAAFMRADLTTSRFPPRGPLGRPGETNGKPGAATGGDYAGPHPVPATNRPVPDDAELAAGTVLQASWGGGSRWFPVTVVTAADDGTVTVRWNGWGSREETVPRDRLAFPPPDVPQPPGVSIQVPPDS